MATRGRWTSWVFVDGAADAATIGWMLAVLTATVCELGVLAARLYFHWRPEAVGAGMAGELLLFSSAIVGLIVLGLIPVVYRIRRVKPPAAVTGVAVVIGVLPWTVIVVQLLERQ